MRQDFPFRYEKANANMISVLLFVVILLFAGYAILDYQKNAKKMNYEHSEYMKKVNSANYLKDALIAEYGYPLVVNETSEFELDLADYTFKGFTLQQVDFGFCAEKTFVNRSVRDYEDVVVYEVPVKHNELICIGMIMVYI